MLFLWGLFFAAAMVGVVSVGIVIGSVFGALLSIALVVMVSIVLFRARLRRTRWVGLWGQNVCRDRKSSYPSRGRNFVAEETPAARKLEGM